MINVIRISLFLCVFPILVFAQLIESSYKFHNQELQIFNETRKIKSVKLDNIATVRGVVVSRDLSTAFIQSKKSVLILDLVTGKLTDTEILLPTKISAGFSRRGNTFLIGDVTGNIGSFYKGNSGHWETQLFSRGVDGFPVKEIKVISKGKVLATFEKDLTTKVGFNYSNTLVGDEIKPRGNFGFSQANAQKVDPFAAVIGFDEVGYKGKENTLTYPNKKPVLARANRTVLYNVSNMGILPIEEFIDQNVKYYEEIATFVVSDKQSSTTKIVNFNKLKEFQGDLSKATIEVKGYFDFIAKSNEEIILGSADSKKISILNHTTEKLDHVTVNSNLRGIRVTKGGAHLIQESGDVSFISNKILNKRTNVKVAKLKTGLARNIDVLVEGRFLTYLDKNGNRVRALLPGRCEDLFLIN